MKTLASQRCVPCEAGQVPFSVEEAQSRLALLPGWILTQDGRRIEKRFKFPDFLHAVDFVNQVAGTAEEEGHHPDLSLGWGYCYVTFQTHKISGLSQSDFIMAAKVEEIFQPQEAAAQP